MNKLPSCVQHTCSFRCPPPSTPHPNPRAFCTHRVVPYSPSHTSLCHCLHHKSQFKSLTSPSVPPPDPPTAAAARPSTITFSWQSRRQLPPVPSAPPRAAEVADVCPLVVSCTHLQRCFGHFPACTCICRPLICRHVHLSRLDVKFNG